MENRTITITANEYTNLKSSEITLKIIRKMWKSEDVPNYNKDEFIGALLNALDEPTEKAELQESEDDF